MSLGAASIAFRLRSAELNCFLWRSRAFRFSVESMTITWSVDGAAFRRCGGAVVRRGRGVVQRWGGDEVERRSGGVEGKFVCTWAGGREEEVSSIHLQIRRLKVHALRAGGNGQ